MELDHPIFVPWCDLCVFVLGSSIAKIDAPESAWLAKFPDGSSTEVTEEGTHKAPLGRDPGLT